MQLENTFKNITTLFYNGDYVEGQKELSQLIKANPSDAILLANRALFNSQLNNDEQAIRDLQRALELQPMNYISYFNMFSILVKMNQQKLAIQNINCSLSVMYTMRGRQSKSMQDVLRAIELADNNIQARVLRGLMLFEKGLYQQSKKQFQNALKLNPSNLIIQELMAIAAQKMDPGSAHIFESCQTTKQNQRLINNTPLDDCQFTEEIDKKVDQFNVLYGELNNQIGGMTQKVPKQYSFYQQVDPNTMDKSIQDKQGQNNSAIASLVEEKFEELNPQTQPIEESRPLKIYKQHMQKDALSVRGMIDEEDRANFSQTSYNQGINDPKHPLRNSEQISITVLNFDFFEPQNCENLQQVYTILSYNHSRDKLITKPVTCQAGVCSWNKTFAGIFVSTEPSSLKIKLYNKQRNQIRDLFLGEFEVLLNTVDLLKIPLQDRKGVPIGDMLLQVSRSGVSIQ